jgi:ParB-like chromosome segregation protein Spo0J
MLINEIRTAACHPLHEVREADKLAALTTSMRAGGWMGRPLLVLVDGDGYRCLTGSHRLAAAQHAGLTAIPAMVIEDGDLDADQWDEVANLHTWEDDDKARWMREAGLGDAADLLEREIAANAADER